MTNNKRYKNIIETIAITKFIVLLFLTIIIFKSPSKGTRTYGNLITASNIILCFSLLVVYLLWLFMYSSEERFEKFQKFLIIEDILFITILTFLILSSNNYQSQYKYLFFFSIITTTISQGQKKGLIMATISSTIILSIDLLFANGFLVNSFFENDLVLSIGFVTIAFILGEYISFENNKVQVLKMELQVVEMELQMLKLKEDVRLTNKTLLETKEHNKFITDFFSNISHELKTPLNVIFSSLQLMNLYNENEENFIEKRKKYLDVMKQNCYRLIKLINNLLDMTKLDSGFMNAHMMNGDIVYIIEDIIMSIVSLAESKGIDIIFDTDVEEKVMAFDEDKIERIILNLLSNALKFTNRGGKIYVTMTDMGDTIKISVKDTGVGIPDDKKGLIFGRFMQIDKTLKRNAEGTGIGLSLVKSFVELHEGNITVESEIECGSEFIITLPVKQSEETIPIMELKKDISERVNIELSDIYTIEK